MREVDFVDAARGRRNLFERVYLIVQRCIALLSLLFFIGCGYVLYIKMDYDGDKGRISRAVAGESYADSSSTYEVAYALQHEKVRDYVATPITTADVEKLHRFAGEYHRLDEVVMRGFNRVGLPEGEGEISSFRVTLMLVNQVVTTFFSYNKSPVFDKAVAELGGYEAYYRGVFGFAGVLAAIDAVALSHADLDKYSDAMIERVLEEQALLKERYDDAVLGRDEGGSDVRAVIMASEPGIIALVKVPRASFEVWKALRVVEREQIAEEMEIFGKGHLFLGVAFDPVKVFKKVFVDEFRAQK